MNRIEFGDLSVPLVTNVDAAIIRTGAEARASLVRQVSSPVRWRESVELLARENVSTFVEIGPGKVLCGLVRQTEPQSLCLNVEDKASLDATRSALSSEQSSEQAAGD